MMKTILYLLPITFLQILVVKADQQNVRVRQERKILKPGLLQTLPTTTLPTTTVAGQTSTVLTTTTVTTVPINTPNATLQTGIGCGTILLQAGNIVMINSSNFGVGNYLNNYACTWKFLSSSCSLSAYCPCFDVPPSFECFGDYLKILDLPYYHQKFCGTTVPYGTYRASTEDLTIRFRSDKSFTGKGFACFVQCTGPGFADQTPPPTNCTNLGFPVTNF